MDDVISSIEEIMSAVTMFAVPKNQSSHELGRVFEEHYDLVYRTAYGITRTAEDAEDIVQTIFLRLLRRESAPDLTKNPKGYFYRAAVNLSLQTLRTRGRHVLTGDSDRIEAVPADRDNEADEVMDRRLWRAISELNENAAQALILRYIHNYSIGQVAKVLGTTRSTIAVSLFRSRVRLKKLIRAYQGEES